MLIHESGHALVEFAEGNRLRTVTVLWFRVFPNFELISDWDGSGAGVGFDGPHESGLSILMGSGLTLIISYVLLSLTTLFRKQWLRQVLLMTSIISAWDIIAYSTFPALGLRHWVFIGGSGCEPIYGASALGITLWMSYAVVFIHAVVYHFCLFEIGAFKRITYTCVQKSVTNSGSIETGEVSSD
jgi:hypothetical protein